MKKVSIRVFLIIILAQYHVVTFAQNVGLGLLAPAGKMHIKGSADVSQLIIDAHSTQGNINPLIKLRKSSGTDLLWIHSDDSTNIFLGLKAGKANVIGPQGVNNAFIGSRAGYSNTNGRDNTIVGTNAFFSNTKASQNTVVGTNALYTQSFAPGGAFWESKNVAIGYEALYSNQPTNTGNGVNNTAVGTFSLRFNTTGTSNTANGTYALYLNTTGSNNTADGDFSLSSNTVGSNNTALGRYTLHSNTTASGNTAIGINALYTQSFNNDGNIWTSDNVAIGYETLYSNQPSATNFGVDNTAVGNYSLRANTTGASNTACGRDALVNNLTGWYNSAFGYQTLYSHVSGDYVTGIGDFANTSVGNLSNATALGTNATVNASYKVRIGGSSVTVVEGQVAYSWPSDGRFKENIHDDVKGLDFILELKPVSYNFNRLAYAQHIKEHLTPDIEKTLIEESQHRSVGFIAQDVEILIEQTGFTSFDAVHAPTNETDNYSMGYAEFVVPLVKGMQEQQVVIERQQSQIDALKSAIEKLLGEHKN
ncbi:MAG TPA: tail fiber domain-containing protein [Saprospiraceae bacterium]|nr:tail fiber domain-containing protein [Saprospiraceae bacterium]